MSGIPNVIIFFTQKACPLTDRLNRPSTSFPNESAPS